MHGHTVQGWDSFFVVEAGAAAALAGLLFVAVSLNISRILTFPTLPGRAAEALLILFLVLAITSLGLVPEQPIQVYGEEILALSAIVYVDLLIMQIRDARKPDQLRYWIVTRMASTHFALLPLIVAGGSLLLQRGGGLYWLVPGVLLSFAAALLDAWVLLVEILR